MKPFAEIVTTGAGHALRSLGMLLLFAQLYALLEAFGRKRAAGYRVLACVQAAAGLLFFSALLDGTFRETYLPFARTYPVFVTALYDAPWLWAAGLLLALWLACVLSLNSDRRYRKTHISADAIKQTVDLLPEGVCFGDAEGTAVFFNVRMDEWCRALTDRPLKSASQLRSFVEEQGEKSGEHSIVRTPDGTALLFSFGKIRVKNADAEYLQITASDITAQYRITAELRENHARLTELRERMREFSSRAAELAMSEELLKARVTVHDEIGHVLLRIKYYLDNPGTTDEGKLLALIRTMNELLLNDAGEDESDGTELNDAVAAIAAAKELGVRVALRGELPQSESFRAILARAIRECAVNAVKHAGATVLTVELNETQTGYAAAFTNDGAPPAEKIAETGGLASLRLTVERLGGVMRIESSPVFRLTVAIRKAS